MKILKKNSITSGLLVVVIAVLGGQPDRARGATLLLEQAVSLAQQRDPWIKQSHHQQAALQAMSVASGTLPDPKVSIAMANLPTDTWDFDQEPMTQFKVGLSQMFPRGDQRAIKREQLRIQSGEWPYLRQDRLALVRKQVSQLWLDGYKAHHSIQLIENNRYLFEQMVEITQSNYGAALGRTRQQDVVRAQLELTRLEDRLAGLHQQQEVAVQKLLEWLHPQQGENISGYFGESFEWPNQLPALEPIPSSVSAEQESQLIQALAQSFALHPRIKAFDQKILASQSEKQLAQQKYKPEWGLNASYGYREDDPLGNERADFFSVGVSFDLPLFTSNRQDQQVTTAIEKSEAIKTQRWQALRSMIANYRAQDKKLQRLSQRQKIYRETLLPQMQEQAEAALTAYTNDDGNFAEVMRARIALLNSEIEILGVDVEKMKTQVQIRYFETQHEPQEQNHE